MEITYELTTDDLWQYNQYYLRHKSSLQSLIVTSWITKTGLIFLCLIMLLDTGIFIASLFQRHNLQWEMLFGPAALIFIVPRLLPPSRKRIAKAASQAPGFLCEHIVNISPEWLAEKTHVNDTKVAWITLLSLEEDKSHFYFFLSKKVAFIIPKRAFTSPHEAQAFLSDAQRFLDAAKKSALAIADDAAVWPPAPRPSNSAEPGDTPPH